MRTSQYHTLAALAAMVLGVAACSHAAISHRKHGQSPRQCAETHAGSGRFA